MPAQGLGERSPIRQTSNLDRHEAEATATSSGPTERWKTAILFNIRQPGPRSGNVGTDAGTKVKDPVQHPVYAAMKDRTSPFGTKGDASKRSEARRGMLGADVVPPYQPNNQNLHHPRGPFQHVPTRAKPNPNSTTHRPPPTSPPSCPSMQFPHQPNYSPFLAKLASHHVCHWRFFC